MSSAEDRFSRISALRPAPVGAAAGNPSGILLPRNAERLAELIDAERRANPFGEHLVVRRWFASPQPCVVGPRARRLLASPGTEDVIDPDQWVFLDTETTGLAGGTGTYAFLVGLAWWEGGGLATEQFFMRDHRDEASLLSELTVPLSQRRVVVTYNGKSFDWPLLETRFRMTRVGTLQKPAAHIDLLHPARRLWQLRVKSLALTELERQILAIERGPDVPSQLIPARYFDYLRGGPAEPIAEVFEHNRMDLRGLAALATRVVSLYEQPESDQLDGAELYGLSRLLERRGERECAGRMFERALACGLPETADRTARRELALLARRLRDYRRASQRWQELLGDTGDGLMAYEQLAIYYEHHAGEVDRAASLTREALVRLYESARSGRLSPVAYRRWHASFQHRLNRLTAKAAANRRNRRGQPE